MPKNLTSDGAAFPPQRAIVANDPRGAELCETCLQDASDRTQYLKDRIEHVDPDGTGVRRLRRVASIAELRALTDHPDRSIILVDRVGLYVFVAEPTLDELEPEIIKPTTGGGRWHEVNRGAKDVANGVPRLNASARVPTERLEASGGGAKIDAASVTRGIVHWNTIQSSEETFNTLGTFADVKGASDVVTLELGDLVIADWTLGSEGASEGNEGGELQIVLVKPDGSTEDMAATPYRFLGPNAHVLGVATATQAGDHTVKVQMRRKAGTGSAIIMRGSLGCVRVIRP